MTGASKRHGAWHQPLLFLATPATSFNHMFCVRTNPLTSLSFQLNQGLSFFKTRLTTPLTYLMYTLRHTYLFQDRRQRVSYSTSKIRDNSSTLKAQQLTGCLVLSGWLAQNEKQKATDNLVAAFIEQGITASIKVSRTQGNATATRCQGSEAP